MFPLAAPFETPISHKLLYTLQLGRRVVVYLEKYIYVMYSSVIFQTTILYQITSCKTLATLIRQYVSKYLEV